MKWYSICDFASIMAQGCGGTLVGWVKLEWPELVTVEAGWWTPGVHYTILSSLYKSEIFYNHTHKKLLQRLNQAGAILQREERVTRGWKGATAHCSWGAPTVQRGWSGPFRSEQGRGWRWHGAPGGAPPCCVLTVWRRSVNLWATGKPGAFWVLEGKDPICAPVGLL